MKRQKVLAKRIAKELNHICVELDIVPMNNPIESEDSDEGKPRNVKTAKQ